MSDLAYKISVMQAALEGKKIELRAGNQWCAVDFPETLGWDWTVNQYRIAPEPRKPRDFWIACYGAHGLHTFVGHAFSEKNPPQLSSGSTYYSVIHVREVIEE